MWPDWAILKRFWKQIFVQIKPKYLTTLRLFWKNTFKVKTDMAAFCHHLENIFGYFLLQHLVTLFGYINLGCFVVKRWRVAASSRPADQVGENWFNYSPFSTVVENIIVRSCLIASSKDTNTFLTATLERK